MQVAVLGAGVAGVTCAYYLASRGVAVTLVERAAEPAAGASFANGGQLSWSFTDALARPALLAALPRVICGRDPAIRLRPFREPPLTAWGLRFLAQCTAARARANTLAVLELALASARLLAELREATGIEFAHAADGKLVLLPPGTPLAEARALADLKRRAGCETAVLGPAEARALEPALASFAADYAGAVHAERDEVGDARAFTRGLAAWLAVRGRVETRYGTTVTGLALERGRLRAVLCDSGELRADAAVVCLGDASRALLRGVGLRAPIYPVRGYSLTLPRGLRAPAISITDPARRILFCPLGGRLRVSGFADFSGGDGRDDDRRIGDLRRAARALAPSAADWTEKDDSPWAGNRPMTPDGRPLTGPTSISGLYLNCGHGMLGWTLAAATGERVARAVLDPDR